MPFLSRVSTGNQGYIKRKKITVTSSSLLYTALSGGLGFNGSNQYLSLSPGYTPAAGAYTLEFWIKFNNIPSSYGFTGRTTGSGQSIYFDGAAVYVASMVTNTYAYSFASAPAANTWYYFVLNRNASLVETMWRGTFVNTSSSVTCSKATTAAGGTSISGGQQTDSENFGTTNVVGARYNVSGYLPGYVTNFRATIGTAVYDSTTSTITAPTEPLTSLANTKYLMLGAAVTTDTSGTQTVTNNNTVTQGATIPTYKPF